MAWTSFLSPVIKKLVDLLAEEVHSLKRVHKEVKSLKGELEIIQPFLRDAEAKTGRGEASEATKVWLQQIREEAARVEDVIDEYLYRVAQGRCEHAGGGFVGSLRKAGCCVGALRSRHDLAAEIRDVNESLREIKDRGQNYGLRPFEQGSSSAAANVVDPRLGSLFVKEEELVGIDSRSKELVRSLVEGPSALKVVSLVGEGGIGKTTLAKRVYNDVAVKEHFDCRVWITVSQSYNVEKILKIMKYRICSTTELHAGEEISTIEDLISLLSRNLQPKRYVVVFDDVWENEFWEVMKHALPSSDNGSRIIITTRNTKVANSFKENHVRELKPWSLDLALELFCKKAFCYEFEGHCPQELRQLSREIVSKCQGLPLVIVAVAGLLSKKEKTKLEWRRVLDNLNYEFEETRQLTSVSKVLLMSYHDLPYNLKMCFLYFGIFPEDYSIWEERLFNLWIAEGFVEPRRDKTSEQVAGEYLDELIHRNLVSFESVQYGVEKWCRAHDLLREIILTKADELGFCQVLERSTPRFKGKCRRLSIHGTTKKVLELVGDCRIRSILLFNINELTDFSAVSSLKKFKLLKVLDFENSPLDELPKEIGNLYHLEYLNLRGTDVKMLPKSVGKLYSLQTLDVSDTLVRELPIEIRKLKNLRYLLAAHNDQVIDLSLDSYRGVRIHEGIGNMEELQTLARVEAHPSHVGFVKELERLKKLNVLSISKLTAAIGLALGASIEKMNCLEELFLTSINGEEVLDLNCTSSPPPLLRFLSLRCQLREFPDWIAKLQNLRGLDLSFSKLNNDPLSCLKDLANLTYIYLYQAYDGEELHFEEGGFRRLKELRLRNMDGLKAVKIDGGAMPLLEDLEFGTFPLMKEMPTDVQRLTNLKSLVIFDMPREFVGGLQLDGGPDFFKIKNVPFVSFWYKRRGRLYDNYKLGSSKLLQLLQDQDINASYLTNISHMLFNFFFFFWLYLCAFVSSCNLVYLNCKL